MSVFLSKMFDVGDLPVLTFGNWVLKAEWLSGLWNYRPMYVFLTFFYVFFKIEKNMTFYVFLSSCTRFPEQWTKDSNKLLSPCSTNSLVLGPSGVRSTQFQGNPFGEGDEYMEVEKITIFGQISRYFLETYTRQDCGTCMTNRKS